MNVRYSKLALSELYATLAILAVNNSSVAEQFYSGVQWVVQQIEKFPNGAPEIVGRVGVRRVPLLREPYSIYYTSVADNVVILRILRRGHSRMGIKL